MMSKYIDADALKDKMFNYYDCVNLNTRKDNYNGETLMNYEVADMIEDCIDNAPIVDVQEIKHAKWETVGNYKVECTNCHHIRDIKTQYGWNFCPTCGSKMDLED